MNKTEFNGEIYHDDRMFVLYVCKCTVDLDEDVISITIYHEDAPENHKWCVVTYRNVTRYMATRVDPFDTEIEAVNYMKKIEPTVPLISLGGKSPLSPLTYDQFVKLKENNNFKEYDYKKMYEPGGANPREVIYKKRYQ